MRKASRAFLMESRLVCSCSSGIRIMWSSAWPLVRKCRETAVGVYITTKGVYNRSPMFIETVFKTTFGLSDVLKITFSALNHVNNIRAFISNMWFDFKGLSSTIKSILITAILNKRTGGATSFIAPKRAGWRPRLVGVSRFRQFSSN